MTIMGGAWTYDDNAIREDLLSVLT